MTLYSNSLWRDSLWNGLWRGRLWGGSDVDLSKYVFYSDYPDLRDLVSNQTMTTTLSADRPYLDVGGSYQEAAEDTPTIGQGGLWTYGAYTVLNGKSNDISDAYWSKGGGSTYGTNWFQASAQYEAVSKSIPTTAGASYTVSFYAYVDIGSRTTGVRVDHLNSASGNYTAITLSEVRKRYSVTVLGEASSGNMFFGLIDFNTSDFVKIYIDTINVTQSTYALPPVQNDTTGQVSVPLNYSDSDEGYKWPIGDGSTCGDNLLDAFDGVADGVELAPDLATCSLTHSSGFNPTAGAVLSRVGGAITITPDADGSYMIHTLVCNIGDVFELSMVYSDYGAGAPGTIIWNTDWSSNASKIFNGSTKILRTAPATGIRLNISPMHLSAGSPASTLSSFSIKQVSDAKGKMVVKWTPMFDASIITSGGENILSTDGSVTNLLRVRDGNRMKLFDETSEATATFAWQANTPYIITAQWGPHPSYALASKMQLTVTDGTTTWQSAVTDFDGSFNPGDYLSVAWGNDYWQKIGSIEIEKEPSW